MGLPFTIGAGKLGGGEGESGLRRTYLAYPWWRITLGLLVVMAVGLVALGVGSVYVPPLTAAKILISKLPFVEFAPSWPASWETIIWQIRFPRIILAGLVGGCLAISGATYQGLFRNPLADPYLIGVAAGAGLGATIVLVTGVPVYFHGFSLLPVAAFMGAIIAVSIAYSIAKQSGGLPLATLLLAGVAIASLAGAVASLIMIRSDPDLRPVLAWLMGGGLVSAQWSDTYVMLPYLVPAFLVMVAYGRILNIFQLNEDEAKQLGVNVERTKIILIALASLTTAAAVSVSGLIGFVGLIAPHAVRLMWGNDHRALLPMSVITGAVVLVVADLAARTVASPSELPVGIVTALCGAPFFLYLLRRGRRVVL